MADRRQVEARLRSERRPAVVVRHKQRALRVSERPCVTKSGGKNRNSLRKAQAREPQFG